MLNYEGQGGCWVCILEGEIVEAHGKGCVMLVDLGETSWPTEERKLTVNEFNEKPAE